MPERMVTLRPLSRPLRPLKSLSTTLFLRSWLTENSSVGVGHVDTELGGRTDRAVDRGGLEELLGRHAASVEAGATHLVPLDDGDGQARRRRRRAQWRTLRAPTDHDDVELVLCAHRRPFFLSARARPDPPRTARSRRQLRLHRVYVCTSACVARRTVSAAQRCSHRARRRRGVTDQSPDVGPQTRPVQIALAPGPDRPPRWPARPPGRSSGHPSAP